MKINEKKSRRLPLEASDVKRPQSFKEAWARLNKKHLILLLVNCVLFIGLYRILIGTAFTFEVQKVTVMTYMISAAVLVLIYVIYNRGFTAKGITADMLPDTMTEKEKDDYIADAIERERRSKWMITFIVPILLALLIDLLDMFVLQNINL